MGGKRSSLHTAVLRGDIDQIITLYEKGACLECSDEKWRTPLMLACMKSDLINVAEVLIELGANVNAYGIDGGTPLHHAAKRGLYQTVKLLLGSGATPLTTKSGGYTPLDLARSKGHCNIVRALEERICFFSGWMRILDGPSFLEAFAPQWVHRQIWAVVLPSIAPNLFDLVIYPNEMAARPEEKIHLGKTRINVPNFKHPDPAAVITNKYTGERYKLLSCRKGDKVQLRMFYKACQGGLGK